MGFFANQMRSVIEWKDADPDLLIWKWNGTNDELKDASKLIINPGQAAIFVYEGQIKAIHDYPGLFELKTANLPFWTSISKIMQGFTSEHKANIYFIRISTFLNQKWGTKSPVKYTDPVYKFPVGMRAFGNFSFSITDVRKFFTEFSSNADVYPISAIRNVIVDRIMLPMTDVFATSGFSYADIDSKRMELSKKLAELVAPEFLPLGFEMSDFRIENTDFDEKTQERIDKISDKMADAHAINAMGNINTQGLNAYSTIERLNAMNTAAANPNGMAGMGVGMGAGMGLGAGMGMMGGMGMPQQAQPAAAATINCSCGAAMNQNAKFCPDCGKPNSQGKVACIGCGAQIKEGAKFCPDCGKPQSASCPKCSASIPGGVKFCPECGEKTQ
ncbi:MAG: SPFH domain-containing protein [Candidatus Riflebacteria bacterium]|nr:SPFH domain-containing protein [Candidatus Riflebacteria bacterium]